MNVSVVRNVNDLYNGMGEFILAGYRTPESHSTEGFTYSEKKKA